MSTSAVIDDEDDVEFVSEGPIRPVLECIDLLSDGEDDGAVSTVDIIEDQVDRQKAQVVSTLDRLARQVAVEKQERAEKCKAFKERVISQQAHGRQELAFSHNSGSSNEAKRCVDIWLKMPGLKPGVINTGTSWRRRSAPSGSLRASPQTCPVINCGRVYDNVALLEGHLKRFDHSPCDPGIMLKGNSCAFYACVPCGQHFDSKEEWRLHLDSKVSSPNPNGHASSQNYQLIVCFACPACYLLFNIRDECLQHMSAKNHFTHSITLHEASKMLAVPIPIPRYVKNRLVALCKEVGFKVKCTTCSKVLTSHMEARAHFNVHCRQGCAIAEADQTVAQVMKQMVVLGYCSSCTKIFFKRDRIQSHQQQMQHEVDVMSSVGRAFLHYSNFSEIQHQAKVTSTASCKRGNPIKASQHQKNLVKNDLKESPAKRKRLTQAETSSRTTVAWACECGLRFFEEDQASKHLLAANQIFHKCGVCGKLMGESSIARLHMSRFHGGAHLSNFLFHCRKCTVEMPRMEDILSHISGSHRGHTYYEEKEEAEEKIIIDSSAKPSTSGRPSRPAVTSSVSPPKREEKWLCRMCEDLFDSEEAVSKHCGDFTSHSFQRFACNHCPQKFFKESTLRRHCVNEHDGQIEVRYFCGLCDSMVYDTEQEFLQHYTSLHSKDYYCLAASETTVAEMPTESPAMSQSPDQLCPCMGSERAKEEKKAAFTKCMKQLASEHKCSYVCRLCDTKTFSYAEMKTHVHLKHEALQQKSFDVLCASCSEGYKDVPSFHSHYHDQHCPLEPCVGYWMSEINGKPSSSASFLNAEEISPEKEAEEFQFIENAVAANCDQAKEELEPNQTDVESEENQDECDDDMRRALALSEEDVRKPSEFDIEMEEALKRSLQEF
ncbi:E3 SUMO-protein ligase ZNF451 [Chanos chanos]|uniref:E3 SUMO-protein ligase ZNF451 n=1 Tax=Chanos chanos TaxID=29144 RepID=A0A6J2V921_CHACN|nr:E3 SUMO-protein ligase ZNF451 [Chanos chanos]